MLSFLRSYCGMIVSGTEAEELGKSKDELSEKNTPSTPAEKKRVRFSETEELIFRAKQTESCARVEGEAVVRVRVKMTKKQAARILSKCREGGALELNDEVARELEHIIVSNGCPESAVKKFSSAFHYHMD